MPTNAHAHYIGSLNVSYRSALPSALALAIQPFGKPHPDKRSGLGLEKRLRPTRLRKSLEFWG